MSMEEQSWSVEEGVYAAVISAHRFEEWGIGIAGDGQFLRMILPSHT